MIPSYELAATPGCRVAMSGQFAHNPGHCGVKQTRPSGLQRLFLHTHTYAHTHTRAHFKRTHIARQTFHTNKRVLWTWRHTASSSAGKSIWTSSRPSAPPWPRLKPTLSTCCQMPLSKSKGGGGAVRGELAGSGISLDVMMMINQEPYNMTADSALLVAFWMNRNASVDRYAIINTVFLSICIGVATWGQRRAASMLHDVDFKTVNKLLTRDALLNVQNAHIWQQSKSISGLNF